MKKLLPTPNRKGLHSFKNASGDIVFVIAEHSASHDEIKALALTRFREKLPDWSINPSDQFWGNDKLEWNFLSHIDDDGTTYPRTIYVSSLEKNHAD